MVTLYKRMDAISDVHAYRNVVYGIYIPSTGDFVHDLEDQQ